MLAARFSELSGNYDTCFSEEAKLWRVLHSSAALAIHSAAPQDSDSSQDDHITLTEVSPCCVITDHGTVLQTLEGHTSFTSKLNE